jgi:hypothetical protein
MQFHRLVGGTRKRRLTVFVAVAVAATVGLGVSVASAHGSRHRPWHRPHPTATASATTTPTSPDNGGSTPTATPTAAPPPAGINGTPLTNADFISIFKVPPSQATAPRTQAGGSSGTFVTRCGTNQNNHNNPANYIVAPGVADGAHHIHDYVGNLSTDQNTTDASLDAAGTTCNNGDKSTYVWPVIRDITKQGQDVNQIGGGVDGNTGQIIKPTFAFIQFRGNAVSKVIAMPTHLRLIVGDAKSAVVNFPSANQRSAWSCSGERNRIVKDKFPLCPSGQLVIRTEDFASCWDGKNLDTANHRDQAKFPDPATGACPAGTVAIPQLHIVLGYRVPPGRSFALDTFPTELRKAITDHSDFENDMPAGLGRQVANCINSGRHC